jgi:hypothetical protein
MHVVCVTKFVPGVLNWLVHDGAGAIFTPQQHMPDMLRVSVRAYCLGSVRLAPDECTLFRTLYARRDVALDLCACTCLHLQRPAAGQTPAAAWCGSHVRDMCTYLCRVPRTVDAPEGA